MHSSCTDMYMAEISREFRIFSHISYVRRRTPCNALPAFSSVLTHLPQLMYLTQDPIQHSFTWTMSGVVVWPYLKPNAAWVSPTDALFVLGEKGPALALRKSIVSSADSESSLGFRTPILTPCKIVRVP